MENILAILTDKEQAIVGSIRFTGIPAYWASLTGKVGIHFDRHGASKQGFVRNEAMQFSKSPLRSMLIRSSLLFTRLPVIRESNKSEAYEQITR